MCGFYFPKQECCLQGLDSVFGMQSGLSGNGFCLQREVLRPGCRLGVGERLTEVNFELLSLFVMQIHNVANMVARSNEM